jgi:sugar transferase EpsL
MKRTTDIVLSLGGLIALSPLLILIALAVWLTSGAPILFRHKRPGLHGRPFTLYKFRTMRSVRGRGSFLQDDEQRVTRLGTLLRSTSLDELPELFNVLRGDMSLVGPRPLLAAFLEHYTPQQQRRHDLRPGITGWAQVNGRNDLTWDDKIALDVWYVEHVSWWLDLHILVMTFATVFGRRGIQASEKCVPQSLAGTCIPLE